MIVPKLRAPVVFVHGLLGFNRLRLCGVTVAEYFPGIPDHIQAAGNHVRVADLSPTKGVVERAHELKEFLDRELPGEAVHILAHSMGGLDSRYMISRLGMANRVLSLTTIGTPHRGSALADWGLRRFERLLKPVFSCFGIPRQAFYDLTTTRCRQFNEEVPAMPGVRYYSVAGNHLGDWFKGRWLLLYKLVKRLEGPNDGIVSLTSAKYGESFEVWEGDHLSLVNWPDPVAQARGAWQDRKPQYAHLLGRLADEGL